jgi:diguanylate cyclase (GGDEF)-like protein
MPEKSDPLLLLSGAESAHPTQRRRLRQLFHAAETFLLFAVIYSLFLDRPGDALILLGACILILPAVPLAVRKHYDWAAGWLLFSVTGVVLLFMWQNLGLQDEALLGYPVLLIVAGIISNARIFLGLLAFMNASILTIGALNSLGWQSSPVSEGTFSSAIMLVGILSVTGYCVYLLMKDIRRLVHKLRQENNLHREARARIEQLVNHDALTGLPNRVLLEDRFNQLFNQSQRFGCKLAVVFIDLDNFKPINDLMGHAVGDDYLKEIARRLAGNLRNTDTVARFGGDEFVVIMGAVRSPSIAASRAHQLLEALRKPIRINGHELTTTASLGISLAPDDATTFDAALRQADLAMYESKKAGRNSFNFFNDSMNANAQADAELIADLHHAIKNDQLTLLFQPQISLADGRLNGCEALLRWHHPVHGLILPERFIPLAESSGLIVEIGHWVVSEACQAMARFDAAGFFGLDIAVNVSLLQLRGGYLADLVAGAIHKSGIRPQRLELEIAESLLTDSGINLIGALADTRALGVRLAIDDFGTSSSNLAYLQDLDVNTIKIDQSFVSRLRHNSRAKAVVRAIIQMADSLGLTTVGEGVEHEDEAIHLRTMGCNAGQGYHWQRPLVEADFRRYLSELRSVRTIDTAAVHRDPSDLLGDVF